MLDPEMTKWQLSDEWVVHYRASSYNKIVNVDLTILEIRAIFHAFYPQNKFQISQHGTQGPSTDLLFCHFPTILDWSLVTKRAMACHKF